MLKFIITLVFSFASLILWAQKTVPTQPKGTFNSTQVEKLNPLPNKHTSTGNIATYNYKALPFVTHQSKEIKVEAVNKNGLPSFIKAQFDLNNNLPLEEKVFAYLNKLKSIMQIDDPQNEFIITLQNTDQLGNRHVKLQQVYRNIPINSGEIILHEYNGILSIMNGQYIATPKDFNITPTIQDDDIYIQTYENLNLNNEVHILSDTELNLIDGVAYHSELNIYSNEFKNVNNSLVYYVEVYPNVGEKLAYVIDANSGEIIEKYSLLCKFAHNHGHMKNDEVTPPPPSVSNGLDLGGINRNFNTFQTGGTHYMIDATKTMYNSGQSNMPDNPVGVIWTIDATNHSPQNSNFEYIHVQKNSTNWTNKQTAISAHYNAGKAYDYYKNTFNRNSINGTGGNIISIINVTESNGQAMDNAFWNGAAMFYGNGNQAFSPLAEALDVAGHELTHGVVQKTANLKYQGESGAINESFADIFGAMIDRDDWQMGEDIVNTAVFTSGALRDLSDPHNGGNSLSDNGYQPAHTDEQYNGSQDNGGVHINSGIPNKAFYLLATAIGKEKAEQIYYLALSNYLTKSSQFLDLRASVIESSTQLYSPTETNAVANAFFNVGIGPAGTSGGGGSTTGEQYQIDLDENPGDEYIVAVPTNHIDVDLYNSNGWLNTLSNSGVLSKPSVTDDGSVIVFIDLNNTMQAIYIDWEAGTFEQQTLSASTIWKNVAVAKDGSRIAALVDQEENKIHVYDFTLEEWANNGDGFELYNPTFSEGQVTGEVLYADVLEWDYSGNYVVYDANNELNGSSGSIEYWDVGFIKVFNGNNFSDGDISKLFSQLPENTSIGNPTFSKNSPYILAFDYFDFGQNIYQVLAANLESGDVGLLFDNTRLGYPNYNKSDSKILFEAETTDNSDIIAEISINANKIESTGNATVLINDAIRGSYFANGIRNLDVSTDDLSINNDLLTILPNPIKDDFIVEYLSLKNEKAELKIYDITGKLIIKKNLNLIDGINTIVVSSKKWPQGYYKVSISTKSDLAIKTIIK